MTQNYKIKIKADELFDTKFMFENKSRHYSSKSSSTCLKKQIVSKEWLKNLNLKDKIDNNIDNKIDNKIDNRIITYNKQTKILKIENKNKDLLCEIKLKSYGIQPIIGHKYIINIETMEIINIDTLKKIKIKNNGYSQIKLNKTEDIITFIHKYSYADHMYDIIKVKLYCTKTGLMIGMFEFIYHTFENLFDFSIEIQ